MVSGEEREGIEGDGGGGERVEIWKWGERGWYEDPPWGARGTVQIRAESRNKWWLF